MPPSAQAGSSIGSADCRAGVEEEVVGIDVVVVVAGIPGGVVPPGMISGKPSSISPSASSSTETSAVPKLQIEQTEHVELLELLESDEELVASSVEIVDGLPSSPIVSGRCPFGGGTIPPPITPGLGTTIIPSPEVTNQMGSTVGCPFSVVVVTELAVSPSMNWVMEEKSPDSTEVWGPKVIGPVSEDLVVVDGDTEVDSVLGPPSSVGAKGLFGKTLLEIVYVSPPRDHDPPQKLPSKMH